MSRPTKAVVDYFPHYVNHGRTMFTLENKYGNNGYSFWFKLLELLGATEHHFIDCNNLETWEFLLAKTRLDEDVANNILSLLSKLGAVNTELWEKKIIWSENFTLNLSAVYSRRSINVYTKTDIMGFCQQKSHSSTVSVNKKPQSIVEYSIVKNSKEDNTSLSGNPDVEEAAKKDFNMDFVKEVIDYLNEKLKTRYTYTAKAINQIIIARKKEKATIDNFKQVIDTKYNDWINEERFCKFLRPQTLFASSHFWEYLNQPKSNNQSELESKLTKEEIKERRKTAWDEQEAECLRLAKLQGELNT